MPIAIIDDERDEASMEVFAVSLSITNVSDAVRAGAVDITRSVTLCRILDDDRKFNDQMICQNCISLIQ